MYDTAVAFFFCNGFGEVTALFSDSCSMPYQNRDMYVCVVCCVVCRVVTYSVNPAAEAATVRDG